MKRSMKRERWRWIKYYRGLYKISNFGRVKSYHRGKIRICKPRTDSHGYLQACLYKNGRREDRFVHHLVLEAFVGPCPEGLEGCHDPDDNPKNNRSDNLRWGTRSSNVYDSIKHGTRVDNQGSKNAAAILNETSLNETSVIKIRRRLSKSKPRTKLRGIIVRKLSKKYKVLPCAIRAVERKSIWSHV